MLITIVFLENFRSWEKAIKKVNYRNKEVITAGGVVFVVAIILTNICAAFLFDDTYVLEPLMLAAAGMGFSGLLDDVYGSNTVKGLKGHFSQLRRGRITTGTVKAIMGLGIACFISLKKGGSILEIMINALIIALSANLLNLMDLRPGRACRFFLVSTLILFGYFLYTKNISLIFWFMPLVASVLVFLVYDSREVLMMGDAGANVLGMSLGIMVVWGSSFYARISALIFLVGIHLFAEYYSLSKIIEGLTIIKRKFL
ncbi:MAG: hypothetical protein L5655_02385 [Thermosediminibacteraceae bacterium]|nr:hypothetical protein [Thermosediminibacteraceae bacterium]